MGTGQMMLTIGALALLSLAILNLNSNLNNNDISLAQNRYRLEALSLMTSYLEQATMYFFDESSTDTASAKLLTDFTLPNNLGLEGNDSSQVDDFDDFNNMTRIDTGLSGIIYKVMFKVDYVQIVGDSIKPSGNREWNKRMTISVTDNFAEPILYRNVSGDQVRDTLTISFVNSYWFYN
ncbi:MAG: hypothetical protein GQ561_04650 [Calditrichae bacterium]|nr:hypothetical protein [Calditrichia bacterium]